MASVQCSFTQPSSSPSVGSREDERWETMFHNPHRRRDEDEGGEESEE